MVNFYGSGTFAGSGAFFSGVSPASGIPQDLSFYRTSQDGIYVFHWGFLPAFISPSLFTADFDLQLDTTPLFNSVNLVTFTKTTAITYQNGNVRKGYAVPVAARIDKVVQTWYARVRTHSGSFVSDYSSILIWTIPQKIQQQTAENLMISLPDLHVYGKGDLLKPVNQRNSNLYLVENMYGQQFDAVYYENLLTQTDNFIDLCRDEFLQQNFGVLFNYTKPSNLQFVDYRWILKNMILASLVGSTNEAIILAVQSFTGVPPEITNIRDLNDFFLITIQDNPIVPGGPQTVFNTSQPYIDATLVVEDITTGLLVPSSAYDTDGAQSKWTMHVATTHTLQATFDVGNPSDPFPVIFDSLSGAFTLTGLVTFTNGSQNITGFGTLFTTELSIGNEITDPHGIYLGEIDQITDNTHAHIASTWKGPTEVNTGYRLLYTDIQLPPPILWDQASLKAGILITVFNPGQFVLS
jgi:hypothetical protein